MNAVLVEPITVKLLQGPKVGAGHKIAGRCISVSIQNLVVSVFVNNGLAKTGIPNKYCSVHITILARSASPSLLVADSLSHLVLKQLIDPDDD